MTCNHDGPWSLKSTGQHEHFLNSTCDIGLNDMWHPGLKWSDMWHSHFLNSTCDIEKNKWQRHTLPYLKIDMWHLGTPSRAPSCIAAINFILTFSHTCIYASLELLYKSLFFVYFRLFVAPSYCSVLMEQSMSLNRRRHDHSVELRHGIIYLKENEIETIRTHQNSTRTLPKPPTGKGTTKEHINRKKKDKKTKKEKERGDDIVPMIYACATLWHETKQEMTQLMKSIFRFVYQSPFLQV